MIRLLHRTPVYRTAEIRRIEALAPIAAGAAPLMERAGLAAAECARQLAANARPVLVFAGPGNNGGDAFVLARHLKAWSYDVAVVFAGTEDKLPPDAALAYKAWRDAGGSVVSEVPESLNPGLVVDGLFGIGLARDLEGRYAALVNAINASGAPVLALDVPSGLESDSGRVLGCAVRATETITFIALKSGLLTLEGPEHCGRLSVATLDLEVAGLTPPSGSVIGAEVLARLLPRRRVNAHKGDFGSVGILGGARGMVGAALLAGRAALKIGAGRVYVGLTADDAPRVDPAQPELMLKSAADVTALQHLNCLAVGPGLGTSPEAESVLAQALAAKLPLVLDADALNLVAMHRPLRSALAVRRAPSVLTPHPAEAARLLGRATDEVQRDRVAAALELATAHRAQVVLKGAGSVCASPDGSWAINTSGNPGMASAGMGDVLTGFVAALIAQGVSAPDALTGAVYLHGAAAAAAVAQGVGPVGLVATDVIDAARAALNTARPA